MRTYNPADLLEIMAAAGPDRPAVVAGAERRTFAQLNERASRVGRHLADAGVGAGEHVAILAHNRVEWIEAMFGVFKIRAVPIPVNFRYVAAELRHVLSDSDSVALIGECSLLAKLEEVRGELPKLRHVVAVEDGAEGVLPPGAVPYERALADADPADGFPERSNDDRYIMYTGGTTGYPKGVEWRCEDVFFGAFGGGNVFGDPIGSPEELAANADQPAMAVVDCAPVMHGAGQWVAFMGLFSGAKVVLDIDHVFDADKALRLVAEEQANVLMLIGDAMARPVADALAGGGGRYDTSSLVGIASGGAPLTDGAKAALRAQLPNIVFLDNYGASETGACGPSVGGKDGTARFMMDPDVCVLDDDLNPVAPGEIGRLARKGRIPVGYYNDPEKTAATFFTDGGGTRWSVPGDYATLAEDGTIVLLGRGSLVINTGGEKVYPEEVEVALKDHPDVADAVVVGLPDERFGQRVGAVVAPRPGAAVTLDELAGHCRGRLAGYKLPRELKVVGEVRRTAVGKSDYTWARSVFD